MIFLVREDLLLFRPFVIGILFWSQAHGRFWENDFRRTAILRRGVVSKLFRQGTSVWIKIGIDYGTVVLFTQIVDGAAVVVGDIRSQGRTWLLPLLFFLLADENTFFWLSQIWKRFCGFYLISLHVLLVVGLELRRFDLQKVTIAKISLGHLSRIMMLSKIALRNIL